MYTARGISEIRQQVSTFKKRGKTVALVPTMGALHSGHASLIQEAAAQADVVIVSIFVNPTQFGPNEDLKKYPRPIEKDLALCRKLDVACVFMPDTVEMYADGGGYLKIQIEGLADYLCGASRPGHFNGVLQIVNKLLNIVQPQVAVFGQKDIQQYRLIETMVEEFNIPVKLIMGTTVREADGLALSSRNIYLSSEQRAMAPVLYQELCRIQKKLKGLLPRNTDMDMNESDHSDRKLNKKKQPELIQEFDVTGLTTDAIHSINEKGLKIDYLALADYRTLQPVTVVYKNMTLVIAGAVYLGSTRLIDNIVITI